MALAGPGSTSAGVSPEVLRQVKLIELRTQRLVNSVFTGEYRSVFKGQGMEFSEVREYMTGDEVRSIDWNVTARMRRPFVKRFIEERELTVMLVVDVSGSERFGTQRRFKNELASELAAVLAMSAIRNSDRVESAALQRPDRARRAGAERPAARAAPGARHLGVRARGDRNRHRVGLRVSHPNATAQSDHFPGLGFPGNPGRAPAQVSRAATRRGGNHRRGS